MAINRAEQTSPFFVNLIDDHRFEIYRNLPIAALTLFALTSKSALDDIRRNTPLHQIMMHLAAFAAPVSADQKIKSRLAVMRFLKLYPELLFVEGLVKDPAGHTIGGSIYKVFQGARDTWALKMIHEKIIPLIPNGEAIADDQYKLQFPRHADQSLTEEERLYDDRNIAQIAQVKEDLDEIAAAFEEDPCTGDKPTKQRTIDAFDRLYSHIAPKDGEVIKTGLHSPAKIMEMIHQFYDDHYDSWSPKQLRVYSLLAIGKALKTSTAVDAQCYKKGLVNIGDNFEPDRTVTYFTSSGVPEGLGDSFFIDVYYGGAGAMGRGMLRVRSVWCAWSWQTMSSKRDSAWGQSSSDGNTQTRTLSV